MRIGSCTLLSCALIAAACSSAPAGGSTTATSAEPAQDPMPQVSSVGGTVATAGNGVGSTAGTGASLPSTAQSSANGPTAGTPSPSTDVPMGGAVGSAGSATSGAAAPSAGASGMPRETGTMRDATTLVAQLGIGWNLGNSLDAVGGETAWGNPVVTPALIQAVAAAGFKAVRVPVTWAKHFGEGPEFTIDPAWIKRVEEVVSYVTDSGMHAIINVHHDGAEGGDGEWLSLRDGTGSMTDAHDSAVQSQFVALWQQIATHFADHDDTLLFESMNEIKVGYDRPDPAYYKTINALNQAFVDTVRATGGNNATRCLVVPGYNTNVEYTLEGFTAPHDPATNRLVLSVHYYDPWTFAGSAETHAWGAASPGADSWGQEVWVDEQFEKLKAKYIDAGLPVIIGEYGAVHQTSAENYRRYYMEYVTKAAVDRGIAPIYWDNGGGNSGSDGFGLLDRASNELLHPEIVKAMRRAATEDYPISAIAKP